MNNATNAVDVEEIPIGDLHSVRSLADSEPGLNAGGIRWILHKHRSELIESGVLLYTGNKPLIARTKFLNKLREGFKK